MPVPLILKHCVIAIMEDRSLRGTTRVRFERALLIAKSRLTEYGFLVRGSEEIQEDQLVLTSKGREREQVHVREGPLKSKKFDAIHRLVESERMGSAKQVDAATGRKKPL